MKTLPSLAQQEISGKTGEEERESVVNEKTADVRLGQAKNMGGGGGGPGLVPTYYYY